jgi:phage terminase large subunit-like protein
VQWDSQSQIVGLVYHRIFQPTANQPLDFEDTVERTLLELQQRFFVNKVLFDPYQMQAVAQRLVRAGVLMEEFPRTVPNLTQASQNLFELIQSRSLRLYPDDAMRLAISRVVAVESARGWRIAKEKQSHRIDVGGGAGDGGLRRDAEQEHHDSSLAWVSGGNEGEGSIGQGTSG